jgi:hypothetical protein
MVNEGFLQIDEFKPKVWIALTDLGQEIWEGI